MSSRTKKPSIQWREWGEPVFRAAEAEGKPVLLALTATWCHWCHVMDKTTYSHPQVIRLINSRFIPVRVDVDQQPDISRRYNQGGYPSLALLDARGGTIAGRVYTPPEEMIPLLEQISSQHTISTTGAEIVERPESDLPAEKPGRAGAGSPVDLVVHRLGELYDPQFGGFGREPKQPPWEALGLLLARYSRSGDKNLLRMVTTTLDAMNAGIYDQNDLGFFRYSVARDWKVPHYEKMLCTNAGLLAAYLEAYQVTGRRIYRGVAAGTLGYLLGTLYDQVRGLFYASQDAGEDYYKLPWKDRDHAAQPAVDPSFYTGWNALAATCLIKSYGVLGYRPYLKTATRLLDQLWSEGWSPDRGLAHTVGRAGRQPRYLTDHVNAAQAFLELYQATGDAESLDRAVRVTQCAQQLFGAADGGFYEVPEELPASQYAQRQEKPVLENSGLAEVLVRLAVLTGDAAYQQTARDTVALFLGVAPGSSYLGPPGFRRMEEDEEQLFLPAGSAWGRAWDMVEQGAVHMVLVGYTADRQTQRLLKAALRIYAPHKVVQLLDPHKEGERITALGFPVKSGPALYVCMGGMCLAPITTPEEVKRVASGRPWADRVQFAEYQLPVGEH